MGTQNHEGIAGAAATVDFYASLAGYRIPTRRDSEWVNDPTLNRREALQTAYAALRAHSAQQVKRLWEELPRINGVRLYGPPPEI